MGPFSVLLSLSVFSRVFGAVDKTSSLNRQFHHHQERKKKERQKEKEKERRTKKKEKTVNISPPT